MHDQVDTILDRAAVHPAGPAAVQREAAPVAAAALPRALLAVLMRPGLQAGMVAVLGMKLGMERVAGALEAVDLPPRAG